MIEMSEGCYKRKIGKLNSQLPAMLHIHKHNWTLVHNGYNMAAMPT